MKENTVTFKVVISYSHCKLSRPPSVGVEHGYCALGIGDAATGAASSMADEADAGVAVLATQSADVAGQWGISVCTCLPSGFLPFCQVQDLLFPQLFLDQAAPAAAVGYHVFPALCVDV